MSDTVSVVVPTVGRPSLQRLLASLARADGPLPLEILLVDDRPRPQVPARRLAGARPHPEVPARRLAGARPHPEVPARRLAGARPHPEVPARRLAVAHPAAPLLAGPVPRRLRDRVRVLRGAGRGPAAARNAGWRAAAGDWIAFLDDDVEVSADWFASLATDLDVGDEVAGSQGRIHVPLPSGRRPTDWERNVAGLEQARWATADMAYRRTALIAVGGFDERFPRAYREDADLALRITDRGWRLVTGQRRILHPVRPADRWVSVRLQRGNADDPLMRARHGPDWRARGGVGRGRRPRHLATTAALVTSAVAAAARRWPISAAALATWAGLTGAFARERIAPGPRTRDEVRTMVATSIAIPPVAVWHWLRGWARVLVTGGAGPETAAVLFDRDGTLVTDVPYNGDPDKVELRPRAREAIALLRSAGVPSAVVSNQSGIGRGLVTPAEVDAVNRRIEQLLGPLGPWCMCPHGPLDGCGCRKPRPGLIRDAARRLGVDVRRCVVIGDIGSDVEAALAAGAGAVLVPTEVTRPEEIAAAPVVARDVLHAVELALGGGGRPVDRRPATAVTEPDGVERLTARGDAAVVG